VKYRILFRKRGRASTSKRLRRISTGATPAVDGGRKVVLRAGAPTTASATSFADRFRIEAVVREADGLRTCAVVERSSGRALALTTCGLAGGWEVWDRFAHECRVLRSLAHSGVPRWVDHGEQDGVAWLLTEPIDGRTLGERMARGERYSDVKLRLVLGRVLDVLAYLHELNPPVYHCDVHPGAIVVSERGQVTLASFGHARSRLDDDAASGRDGYAPSWRFDVGPAADLWSLGATMLAVAAGREGTLLPRRDGTVDVDACMKASPLREQIRALLVDDPDACITAAARVRDELRC
jgi:serine/threonine protein kinase